MNDTIDFIYFALFAEIATIKHLSNLILERHLPAGFLASHFAVLNHLVRVRDNLEVRAGERQGKPV